ncbi:hypothetical protein B0H10DRAFT_2241391 [Mycena sp. CBHHK59/15]|nr:hypothetical protein B0H10DRAFT_2241391 [Mycena sp. CBHHK59/15]
MEDDGEDDSDDQLSTDDEEDVTRRRVLEEVTNTENPARPTAKKAARKPLQRVAENFPTARRTKLMHWN